MFFEEGKDKYCCSKFVKFFWKIKSSLLEIGFPSGVLSWTIGQKHLSYFHVSLAELKFYEFEILPEKKISESFKFRK